MIFDPTEGFELPRNEHRQGSYNKSFWANVEEVSPGLSRACGCYIFVLRYGKNLMPWYVGKAERQAFVHECFTPSKKLIFNDVLIKKNGTPLLYFIPRKTAKGAFSKPTKNKYADIEFLETMLIGMALERNPNISNIQKTKLLRNIRLPGVINSPQAAPTKPVRELRNILGLSK